MKTVIWIVVSALVVSAVATGQRMTSRIQRTSGNTPFVDADIRSGGRLAKWTQRQNMMLSKLKRFKRMAEAEANGDLYQHRGG